LIVLTPGALIAVSAAMGNTTAYASSTTYQITVTTASKIIAGGGVKVTFPSGITIANTITA